MNKEIQSIFYRSMGTILRVEPTEEVFAAYVNDDMFADIPYVGDNVDVERVRSDIYEWLKSDSIENLTRAAYNDFFSLFIGPATPKAPPWGSVYLNTHKALFQEETLAVREFYRKCDLMLPNKNNEPDDHIGLELIFIAHLIEQEKTDLLREFLDKYVLSWCKEWLCDVKQYGKTPFYKGLATIIACSLQEL